MRLPWQRREARESVEDPRVPISSDAVIRFFGIEERSTAGENVTIESALGVPAVFTAVNFIAGTIAGLPIGLFKKGDTGPAKVNSPLSSILHNAPNAEMSSFEWRKWLFEQVLTYGRGFSFIDRNASGRIKDIWPLDPLKVTVRRVSGRKLYDYTEGSKKVTYEARDIIDVPFMLRSDGVKHRSPIMANAEAIGLAQAVTKYGGKFFENGGVPPFAVSGNFQSGGTMQRAADDLDSAVRKAAKDRRQALVLPTGLEIKSIGADAEKAQMIETQRFCVEQIARIYSLPPTFLQDLTHGTFSNTEQQDLHFVKHTVKRWIEQFEQELNLKLFGRTASGQYVKMNVDGLLRGDFKTRMEGYARAIQAGIYMPNEARELEERPRVDGADRLFIQGANVPIDEAGQQGQQGQQNQEDQQDGL